MSKRTIATTTAAVLLALAGAAHARPQNIKPGSTFYTNDQFGFRFKPPADYNGLPLQPGENESGLTARFAGPRLIVGAAGKETQVDCMLDVYALVEPPAPDAKPGETVSAPKRPDIAEVMVQMGHRYSGFDKSVAGKPAADETVKVGKIDAHHRTWKMEGGVGMVLDVWSFPMPRADIAIIYESPGDRADKFLDVFEKSAKTFQPVERKAGEAAATGNSYEDQLSRASAEAASTPGGKWHAIPTPSKKYIIKTSSDNKKFIDEVISRLEKSRELYERDFPPKKGFDHVSIVRVCGSEEEFHKYGGTGGGVAGWFNPSTTELVLYDAVQVNRNESFAVMSHEAFHQYCHFLFDQSEAHRWFDEGHGDYYGGAEFKGSKATITPHMPGGLDRLSIIREMVAESNPTFKPLKDHLNYNHQQWQSQGPSNVSCYAQSWSIIYMLREGALGNIHDRKVWKDEYAQIIPHYVETLYAGFQKAYEELRKPLLEQAAKEGRQPTDEELASIYVPEGRKQEIWKAAMDASWGKVDLDDFEQRWLFYVRKDLK
jgi:hypothetical protein